MKKTGSIGRSESDVLRFIVERGGASVSEVGDHLAATKGQTRNTALNMMERLRKKGFLSRKKVDGVFQYEPTTEKETLLQGFVADFVEGILGGSATPLIAYLGGRAEVDEAQLDELRKLVRDLEATRDDA
ncbi:MAG: BlaI/MecI/CopY family transcriptional regulator [Fimbriimonas sp.]